MHFAKFIAAAACCFSLGVAAQPKLLDRAVYKRDVAPSVIQRINDFRDNAGSLQPEQDAYLDKILKKVQTADFSGLDAVELEANELFGKEAARTLLAGNADLGLDPLDKRAAKCSCATDSDYCGNNTKCSAGGCSLQKDQCGTFGVFHCDGRCG